MVLNGFENENMYSITVDPEHSKHMRASTDPISKDELGQS